MSEANRRGFERIHACRTPRCHRNYCGAHWLVVASADQSARSRRTGVLRKQSAASYASCSAFTAVQNRDVIPIGCRTTPVPQVTYNPTTPTANAAVAIYAWNWDIWKTGTVLLRPQGLGLLVTSNICKQPQIFYCPSLVNPSYFLSDPAKSVVIQLDDPWGHPGRLWMPADAHWKSSAH